MNISFHQFHRVHKKILPILQEHSDFINEFGDNSDLDLFDEAYLSSSEEGNCWVLLARDGVEIIGYLLFFMGRNLHRKGIIEGIEEAFYIKEKYRGKLGLEMMDKFESFLKDRNVKRVTFGVPTGVMKSILLRKNYVPTYEIYVKDL